MIFSNCFFFSYFLDIYQQNLFFQVSHVNGRKPVFEEKERKLIFNKEAIVEDFHHIGKHVVKRIETKSTNDNIVKITY